jgi:hypothetical protein
MHGTPARMLGLLNRDYRLVYSYASDPGADRPGRHDNVHGGGRRHIEPIHRGGRLEPEDGAGREPEKERAKAVVLGDALKAVNTAAGAHEAAPVDLYVHLAPGDAIRHEVSVSPKLGRHDRRRWRTRRQQATTSARICGQSDPLWTTAEHPSDTHSPPRDLAVVLVNKSDMSCYFQ